MQKNPKPFDRLQWERVSPTTDSLSESKVHGLAVQRRSPIRGQKKIKRIQLKMVQRCCSHNCSVWRQTCYLAQCDAGVAGVEDGGRTQGWGWRSLNAGTLTEMISERPPVMNYLGLESASAWSRPENVLSAHLAIERVTAALNEDTPENSQNKMFLLW